MEANAFVAEVYRRMQLRHPPAAYSATWEQMSRDPQVLQAAHEMAPLLPKDKDAAILDIGFGRGWFMAACALLGYTNVSGAEFGASARSYVNSWPGVKGLQDIETSVGDLLAHQPERYDFIHMSHVIEHIPKHSLLYVVDALYLALRRGGTLLLRTPNMEGPCANSSLYVTLGHEYGFAGSNLVSLLNICNFDDIQLRDLRTFRPTLKQRIGQVIRWPALRAAAFRHRLFGVNYGGKFGTELVVTAKRGDLAPHFNHKFK